MDKYCLAQNFNNLAKLAHKLGLEVEDTKYLLCKELKPAESALKYIGFRYQIHLDNDEVEFYFSEKDLRSHSNYFKIHRTKLSEIDPKEENEWKMKKERELPRTKILLFYGDPKILDQVGLEEYINTLEGLHSGLTELEKKQKEYYENLSEEEKKDYDNKLIEIGGKSQKELVDWAKKELNIESIIIRSPSSRAFDDFVNTTTFAAQDEALIELADKKLHAVLNTRKLILEDLEDQIERYIIN